MTVEIAAARPEEIASLAELWQRAWYDAHLGHVPEELLAERDAAYFVDGLTRRLGSTLVARDPGGGIVGLAIVDGPELLQLMVDRETRGRGAGAALLTAAEELIGRSHPAAFLGVVPGNARARAFYAREGWVDEGPETYDAPTRGGHTVPVPIHRYTKALR